ncbi:MAG: DUF4199 domain-containing protein [Roseivirga sp.]|nr:DUF4199 domain-containing protein [Roseivirga sp.]
MKKFVIRYGIIGGLTSVVLGLLNWFLIAKPLGFGVSQWVGYLSIIVSLMCVPLGIKYFRDKLNNGVVSMGQSFRIGMGITLVASVIIFIYSMLFFFIAGNDFDQWKEEGTTQSQMADMPEFATTFWFQGLIMFITVLLIGFIINLISSLLLKSNQPKATT